MVYFRRLVTKYNNFIQPLHCLYSACHGQATTRIAIKIVWPIRSDLLGMIPQSICTRHVSNKAWSLWQLKYTAHFDLCSALELLNMYRTDDILNPKQKFFLEVFDMNCRRCTQRLEAECVIIMLYDVEEMFVFTKITKKCNKKYVFTFVW